ncbi:cardiolipin synthase (CMP-forming) isoform X2 [Lynx canadensis]|uniref:cardiolipin synthase (CMP-forming) isoform X2 n=1 Tax=Lynx canadensis TaxID=61383 RepID=UPI0011B06DFB|nr:cardiolipin synthase (CMP-forming) isoform X2 [Lynx canadensis]
MLASRVARGSWGALRSAAWAPGARPGKGRARGSLLRSVPGCLGCLVERWWLRPAALGLRLPGTGPRGHCSGAGKAAPGPAAGGGAAAEARAGRWGPASAASLYENPWTIPNMLSMTRIGLAPVLGYLIIEEDFNIALGVFALAGLTDLLDGFIARNWANQKSALGSALDPLADKILISILYVSLTYADLIPAVSSVCSKYHDHFFLEIVLSSRTRPRIYPYIITITNRDLNVKSVVRFCSSCKTNRMAEPERTINKHDLKSNS